MEEFRSCPAVQLLFRQEFARYVDVYMVIMKQEKENLLVHCTCYY
jgi:hypothetical protein